MAGPKTLIVVEMGGAYSWSWYDMPLKEAEEEHCGIVEAGGNVWETDNGLPPDGSESDGYEVVALTDVSSLEEDAIEAMARSFMVVADVMIP